MNVLLELTVRENLWPLPMFFLSMFTRMHSVCLYVCESVCISVYIYIFRIVVFHFSLSPLLKCEVFCVSVFVSEVCFLCLYVCVCVFCLI